MSSKIGGDDKISKKIVFAVEGKDDTNFLLAIIDSIGLDASLFHIENVGGNGQFHDKITALMKREISPKTIKVFACFRDREKDKDPFASLQGSFKKAEIPVPVTMATLKDTDGIKTGIFIWPLNPAIGDKLEDICLEAVKDSPPMKCVNQFIDCVNNLDDPPKNLSKSKAQAYLATLPEIFQSVGVGAQNKCWNFNASVYQDIKDFIKQCYEEAKK